MKFKSSNFIKRNSNKESLEKSEIYFRHNKQNSRKNI